jgi:predicted nucleic acid-binding protein
MRLVIDTNVMVESITSRSPYYKISQSFVQGKNEIVISNAILLEYFDVLENIEFPEVRVISPEEFVEKYLNE